MNHILAATPERAVNQLYGLAHVQRTASNSAGFAAAVDS
jgi:hypothetical protein